MRRRSCCPRCGQWLRNVQGWYFTVRLLFLAIILGCPSISPLGYYRSNCKAFWKGRAYIGIASHISISSKSFNLNTSIEFYWMSGEYPLTSDRLLISYIQILDISEIFHGRWRNCLSDARFPFQTETGMWTKIEREREKASREGR